MKTKLMLILAAFIVATSSWGVENAKPAQEDTNKEVKKDGKVSRKKKAAICAECGKPESICECPHAATKKDKASSHGPGDGHNH